MSAHLLRNQAESMRRTRSVAIVPPLGCVNAATAGIMAMKTGLECHHVVSSGDASLDMSSFRQEGAATATEVWRRGSRALGESGGAVQHPLAQKGGYLGARGVAVGRRAIHDEEATLDCSLGMAITKPRRWCRARHVVRQMTTVAVAVAFPWLE
jgi:hypothetical protein